VARYIAEAFNRTGILDDYPNVDGVCAFVHSTGCGMADSGDGYEALQRTLWGYARHPNMAGVLMVGLGCEVNQIPFLLDAYGLKTGERFQTLTIQETGGTRRTVDAAIERIKAEHLLTRRAVSREVGEKLIERIHWWEDYTRRNGGEMNNNPSPGNKAGGLTTILEKSLGAAAKGGTTNLVGVYKYAEPVTAKGFVFMDSPGYDPCAVTGQVASGANVVCFTTGRGSVFGFKPSPSIKLATNTPMYSRMAEDMDINCGGIAEGDKTIEQVGREIFEKVLEVASGTPSKSEALGFGDAEFIPWQIGAVM
jgi:altronate hydrolase